MVIESTKKKVGRPSLHHTRLR